MIFLKDNEYFVPGKRLVGGNWIKKENAQLKDIIKRGKISTYKELKFDTDLMMIDEWRYLQLRHFVEKQPHPIRYGEDHTPLERLYMREKSKNDIARIYKILSARDDLDVPPYIKKWENELGSRRNKDTMHKIMKLTHSSVVNLKMVEMNYKCLARWYTTPDKTSIFQPEKSSECWRGCKAIGTKAHLWWDCPTIKKYCKEVLQLLKEITNKEIPADPWICLSHGVDSSVKQYKTSVIPTLINVAKGLILKKMTGSR